MLAALPYHETPQFVRLVQILRLDPRGRFAFLEPMQQSGAPAPREALVLRCVTDRVRLRRRRLVPPRGGWPCCCCCRAERPRAGCGVLLANHN